MVKRSFVTMSIAIAAGALLTAGAVCAQQSDRRRSDEPRPAQRETTTQPASSPSMEESMEVWMQYSEPDEHHQYLEPMVGAFTAEWKMWMAPGSEPMTARGEVTNEWVLGGRFLQGRFKGDMMGQEFEGLSYWGYDRYAGVYNGSWRDSMSTMTYTNKGTVDPTGKVFTMHGAMPDPAEGGRMVISTEVTRIIDNNKHVMEFYKELADGSIMKVMEMTFTRKKSS